MCATPKQLGLDMYIVVYSSLYQFTIVWVPFSHIYICIYTIYVYILYVYIYNYIYIYLSQFFPSEISLGKLLAEELAGWYGWATWSPSALLNWTRWRWTERAIDVDLNVDQFLNGGNPIGFFTSFCSRLPQVILHIFPRRWDVPDSRPCCRCWSIAWPRQLQNWPQRWLSDGNRIVGRFASNQQFANWRITKLIGKSTD